MSPTALRLTGPLSVIISPGGTKTLIPKVIPLAAGSVGRGEGKVRVRQAEEMYWLIGVYV